MRKLGIRFVLAVAALGGIGVGITTTQGQVQDAKIPVLADFDARDVNAPANPPDEQVTAAAIVEERDMTLALFQASPNEARFGTRLVPNKFGLPKVYRREGRALSGRSLQKPEQVARGFLQAQPEIFRLSSGEVDKLRLLVQDAADNAVFLAFNQTFNGIDVFNAQIKFTLSKDGEVIQVGTAEVVPGLSLSTTPKLSPKDAVEAAFSAAGTTPPTTLAPIPDANGKAAFQNPVGGNYTPITAELAIFPMTATSARLAYRVFLEIGAQAWYEMLIDAADGSLLFRHNLYVYSGQARVWPQSPLVGQRSLVTFPAASPTNPSGWLSATATVTTGNNVDAYLDANGDDSPDIGSIAGLQNGRASSATQTFDFPFGDGTVGADPRAFQAAAVTNLFYLVNVAHDYYYGLGFDEAAGNFQTDNFGRGGSASDAVRAQAQSGALQNNAAFASTADGMQPTMRMGVFTRAPSSPTDDLDSDYDGQVVMHEYGHGVSNRLVGARTSTSCLRGIQSRALGEGWSDYFAISYYNNPVLGAYIDQNSIRGSRRQSYEGYTYTYEDIGNATYEVHNDGEIWAAALWDLRKSLGPATTDRLVINGLKGTPCSPSMTDARDAILSADQATDGSANRLTIWTVFARHGLGFSAVGTDGSFYTGTRYDAAYDLPPSPSTINPLITSNPFSLISGLGDRHTYKVTASNPAGGVLAYALTSGPSGMTVDSVTGVVNWTVTSFTSQRTKITVTDGRGGKVIHGYSQPIRTVLSANETRTIAAPQGRPGYATIAVPANTPILQVALRGGTGDASLFVTDPTGIPYSSKRNGNNETLSFPNPGAGVWQIEVDAAVQVDVPDIYAGVGLTASLITPAPLGPTSITLNLSGEISSETFYRVTVPPGSNLLSVSTSGGVGDVDLRLRRGFPPVCQDSSNVVGVPCVSDFRSIKVGNTDSVVVPNPSAGDWYIDLHGFDAYSGVKLDISLMPVTIALTNGGSGGTSTLGTAPVLTTGYATASVSGAAPFGTAVFSYKQNGVVVSEVGVPASPPTQNARIFVDYRTGVQSGIGTINVDTGFAMVNRGSFTASVTYILRDRSGQTVAVGHGNLTSGAHVARFVEQLKDIAPDFNLPANFPTTIQYGSLEIISTQPVSILALRLTPNQRGDVLMTSTPVADLSQAPTSANLYLPQVADGGGYTTSVTLLNTSNSVQTGALALFDDAGAPLSVRSVVGTTATSFAYSIPAAGTFVFQTDGSPSSPRVGWARVTPASGSTAPIGAGIFSYSPGGILITESGVPSAVPTTRARLYVDKSNGHDTGLAIASPGVAGDVSVTAFESNGTTMAGNGPKPVSLSALGHRAAFVGEFVTGLPDGFTGVAEVTSTTPFVALTLRSLTNSRGDFLLTAFPIADANHTPPAPIVFPHIANGDGYATQFIFISSAAGAGSVSVNFLGDNGSPLNIEHTP